MNYKKYLFFLYIILCLVGCSSKPVTFEELIGTWVVEENSLNFLPLEFQDESTTLTINVDSSFLLSELPGWDNIHISGNGVCRLNKRLGRQELELDLVTYNSPPSNLSSGNETFRLRLWVERDGDKPSLFFYLGDPDSEPRIYLEKESGSNM